mgnify:CR=1 FL=1
MAHGREYSARQRKIIDRYYDNLDTIVATRLAEIVSDMALAAGDDKKLESLWTRAEKALRKTDIKPTRYEPVLQSRDPEALAALIARLS